MIIHFIKLLTSTCLSDHRGNLLSAPAGLQSPLPIPFQKSADENLRGPRGRLDPAFGLPSAAAAPCIIQSQAGIHARGSQETGGGGSGRKRTRRNRAARDRGPELLRSRCHGPQIIPVPLAYKAKDRRAAPRWGITLRRYGLGL